LAGGPVVGTLPNMGSPTPLPSTAPAGQVAPATPAAPTPLGLLADALERLRDQDLHQLPGADQAECLTQLFAHRNRVDAEITRRVAALDRSGAYAANHSHCHSAASWLRKQVRLAPNAASEQVRVARRLQDLPQAASAFAAGQLAFQHCASLTRVLEEAPAAVVAEAEPDLVAAARLTDPHRFNAITRHLRHTFDPEATAAEADHLHRRRRLHLSQSIDGLFFIDGVLTPECGAALRTALDAIEGPPSRGDERTPSQRQHDALQDLVRRQLDGGKLPVAGGQRPHLTLTADLKTLARLPGSPAADLDWGQPLPAETLRRIACDCQLTPILVSESGDPLSVGRTRRFFTAAQRRALVLRDKGCVLCGRPPAWTEPHHIEHWIEGGETAVSNAALTCRRCHRRLHEGGHQLVRKPDGTWTAVPRERPP
jgi:hypothetical protein